MAGGLHVGTSIADKCEDIFTEFILSSTMHAVAIQVSGGNMLYPSGFLGRNMLYPSGFLGRNMLYPSGFLGRNMQVFLVETCCIHQVFLVETCRFSW